MNLKHCVIMSEDIFNTIKVMLHNAHIDARKIREVHPSYMTGKLADDLKELRELLEAAED